MDDHHFNYITELKNKTKKKPLLRCLVEFCTIGIHPRGEQAP
jgi:hypothetical protein